MALSIVKVVLVYNHLPAVPDEAEEKVDPLNFTPQILVDISERNRIRTTKDEEERLGLMSRYYMRKLPDVGEIEKGELKRLLAAKEKKVTTKSPSPASPFLPHARLT